MKKITRTNWKKLKKDYPVVLCSDGYYRYQTYKGNINMRVRGYKTAADAERARNDFDNIPYPKKYITIVNPQRSVV